ncbi:MAG: alpha-mannosidase, partial [Prochlorothrix sp.]
MPQSAIDPATQTAHLQDLCQKLSRLGSIPSQTGWKQFLGEGSIETITAAAPWDNWPEGTMNDRGHIAWDQGRQVLWLVRELRLPAQEGGYDLRGLEAKLALMWWAEAAQIFVNGHLVQEGDLFDCSARILLTEATQGGEVFQIAVRLVSPGHDPGALVKTELQFEIGADRPVESLEADQQPEPQFIAQEFLTLLHYAPQNPQILQDLTQALAPLPDLLTQLQAAQTTTATLQHFLAQTRQSLLPWSDFLKERSISLLGHAHLDLAWLWPIAETWEVAERTFRSVLNLQKTFPELIFGHSSPALYAWFQKHRSDLFAEVQAGFQAGTWEAIAGLWVEPDAVVSGGEALVRQVLYGQRYVEQELGQINRVAWLPDTFGFGWQLPQILRQGGVDWFLTQKLTWNDTTSFPHALFHWQSPDGTEIQAMMTASIGKGVDPLEMVTAAAQWEQKTGLKLSLWLPGVGDHGGGPTRDMLEQVRRWQRSPLFPYLQWTKLHDYLDEISQGLEINQNPATLTASTPLTSPSAASASPEVPQSLESLKSLEAPEASKSTAPIPPQSLPLPRWSQDLYLELHRGCYTTHGDQKRYNRQAEHQLYEAELWASCATLLTKSTYPKAELETAWKRVLFNQFHDILPGSSIPEVYETANPYWEAALATAATVKARSLQQLAQSIALADRPHPEAQPWLVFNALAWDRTAVIELPVPISPEITSFRVYNPQSQALPTQISEQHTLLVLTTVPALGYTLLWVSPDRSPLDPTQPQTPPNSSPCTWNPQNLTLSNEFLEVTLDPRTGEIAAIWDRQLGQDLLYAPGNQFQFFRDRGQYWDAWNIDPNYEQNPLESATLVSLTALETGPLRVKVRGVWQFNQSRIVQDYCLEQRSPQLQLITTVEWQETQVLWKVAFPLEIGSTTKIPPANSQNSDHSPEEPDNSLEFTTEIACGAMQRSLNPQTPQEQAQWEVPIHRWADLSRVGPEPQGAKDGAGNPGNAPRSTESWGVSLLNDCKYGCDAQETPQGSQLRLTLLRSPLWPNPHADRGQHQFTYALYSHGGNWQGGQTVQQGYNLNQPLTAINLASIGENSPSPAQILPQSGSLLRITVGDSTGDRPDRSNLVNPGDQDNPSNPSSPGNPSNPPQPVTWIPMAFKQQEDHPNQWILRGYESEGQQKQLQFTGLLLEMGLLTRSGVVNGLELDLNPQDLSPQ